MAYCFNYELRVTVSVVIIFQLQNKHTPLMISMASAILHIIAKSLNILFLLMDCDASLQGKALFLIHFGLMKYYSCYLCNRTDMTSWNFH